MAKLKMKPEDYNELSRLIKKGSAYRNLRDYKLLCKHDGESETRMRWDMLWAIPRDERAAWFARGIYDYLDDSHIDSALKAIIGGYDK